MRSQQKSFVPVRSIAALILLGMVACGASGCGPVYGYSGYPEYGYAPYWGWWGYGPVFVRHHPWEEHHGDGHHTEFYHGGVPVGHEGGGAVHAGGGGGGHAGGGGGGGHR